MPLVEAKSLTEASSRTAGPQPKTREGWSQTRASARGRRDSRAVRDPRFLIRLVQQQGLPPWCFVARMATIPFC